MKDYYAILHVLPSAEIDVIKAAYRALSRKYHPDTYEGDKAYASKRMQEINDAFGVIGDPDKRKKYDAERERDKPEEDFNTNGDEPDARLEEDWEVACKYCPDATDSFNHLNRLSRSLAFAFKSYLLDSKQFTACKKLRDKFKAEFLHNYFGTNPAVQNVGEKLVLAGEIAAAKSVNRAVKVMGQSLSPAQLIRSLNNDYPHLKSSVLLEPPPTPAQQCYLSIRDNRHTHVTYHDLLRLLKIPYNTSILGGRFDITYQGRTIHVSNQNMRAWVMNTLCSHPDLL